MNEKEIHLINTDYMKIKDYALYLYMQKSIGERKEFFTTMCTVNSFLDFCKKNNYNIIDGKIYKKEQNS